jgi:hypothetical protein
MFKVFFRHRFCTSPFTDMMVAISFPALALPQKQVSSSNLLSVETLKETSLPFSRYWILSAKKTSTSLILILCKQLYDTQAEEAIALRIHHLHQQKPEFQSLNLAG